jgi:hypothetical protein
VSYQDDHRETAKLNGKQRENLGGKERDPLQLIITLEVLQLLRPVTVSGLYIAIKMAFDGCSTKELKQILSILGATRYVVRRDEYFTTTPGLPALAEFDGFNPEDLRARILHYYKVHQPQLYQLTSEPT